MLLSVHNEKFRKGNLDRYVFALVYFEVHDGERIIAE